MNYRLARFLGLLLVALASMAGCDNRTDGTGAAGDVPANAAPASAAEPGYFTGRITLADGSPIAVSGVEYEITISGVTEVGENNTFRPEVGPDGSFRLRLPQGLFKPPYGTITVPFEGKKYSLWLDPVDPAKGTRESTPGIAQNFVWRLTGPRPGTLNPEVNNANHWFGSTIPVIATTFRNDIGENARPPADGTRITWTVRPTSKLLDGSEAKSLTLERTWRADGTFDALNDLPAANYEVSGVATLPDGSTKTVLLTDLEDDRYKPLAKVTLQPDEALHHYVYLPRMVHWAVE